MQYNIARAYPARSSRSFTPKYNCSRAACLPACTSLCPQLRSNCERQERESSKGTNCARTSERQRKRERERDKERNAIRAAAAASRQRRAHNNEHCDLRAHRIGRATAPSALSLVGSGYLLCCVAASGGGCRRLRRCSDVPALAHLANNASRASDIVCTTCARVRRHAPYAQCYYYIYLHRRRRQLAHRTRMADALASELIIIADSDPGTPERRDWSNGNSSGSSRHRFPSRGFPSAAYVYVLLSLCRPGPPLRGRTCASSSSSNISTSSSSINSSSGYGGSSGGGGGVGGFASHRENN
ncbi:unnamed protein product [Trichogramma brassicae]|uniref:Uncharacterized protein n=1 Tax=Trichogramma brassicae TaxID=86971 RepID=A0A6H5J0T9_9HYME|nr:unnamed protein product [Trichogramma brassicae]